MFSQYKGNEFLTNTETPTPFFTPIKSFYPILPSPRCTRHNKSSMNPATTRAINLLLQKH